MEQPVVQYVCNYLQDLVPCVLNNQENIGMQKLSRIRRRNAGIFSIRQVSSTQLSAICATYFPSYLEHKVLGSKFRFNHTQDTES